MRDLTIVFDLDGTLVETAPDLVHALNHALASRAIAPVALPDVRQSVSFGSRGMIEHALALRGLPLGPTEIDRLQGLFLEYYADNLAVSSRPFPSVPETLGELRRRGARLAVCTNKQELYSRRLLEALDLAPAFSALAGRDTLAVMKPHPDHLLGAIRMAGGEPARAVMIGDSETDIRTAQAAAVPVVAVTFGYTDEPVATFAPDAVIDHYDELVAAIERVRPR